MYDNILEQLEAVKAACKSELEKEFGSPRNAPEDHALVQLWRPLQEAIGLVKYAGHDEPEEDGEELEDDPQVAALMQALPVQAL